VVETDIKRKKERKKERKRSFFQERKAKRDKIRQPHQQTEEGKKKDLLCFCPVRYFSRSKSTEMGYIPPLRNLELLIG